jgi:hypothetical protein
LPRPHDFRPLFDFFAEELREACRRERQRGPADLGNAGTHGRVGEAGIYLPVDGLDDLRWGVPRRADARESSGLEAGYGVADERNIGQGIQSRT